MLKVLTLYTLQQVFEFESQIPLSALAKQSYIECLLYHFEGKEPTIQNAGDFEILRKDITNPGSKHFLELEQAGLVKVTSKVIEFPSKWYRYIDKSQLDKTTPDVYLAAAGLRPAREFEQEMLTHGSSFDLLGMRHKLKPEQIEKLIKEFFMEQEAKQKHYYNVAECAGHCINWFGKKKFDMPLNTGKSGGKILGRD